MTTIIYVLYYINEKTFLKMIFTQTITLNFRYTIRHQYIHVTFHIV